MDSSHEGQIYDIGDGCRFSGFSGVSGSLAAFRPQRKYIDDDPFSVTGRYSPMPIRRSGGLAEDELTHSIIGAFFVVHRELGFGFLEHVYASALEIELRDRGHTVARELGVIVRYRDMEVAHQRLDMVVDDKVILEIKASERLHQEATRQLFNYLRATNLEVGLLLHFGRSARFHRVFFEH